MQAVAPMVMLALALVAAAASALAGPSKPKVPAGRDPGGTAVAIVGAGIEYTRADISARLARDGEGQLVGWDFADNDHFPYAAMSAGGAALARIVLGEGQATRLVVVRVPANTPPALAPALQFVAETGTRIALLLPEVTTAIPMAPLADAARRLASTLLVVPARLVAAGVEAERAGLLVVAAGTNANAASHADVAVPLTASAGSPVDDAVSAAHAPDDIAAARVAALAARLVAVQPDLRGAALKARIQALAKPRDGGRPSTLPDVARIRWLE